MNKLILISYNKVKNLKLKFIFKMLINVDILNILNHGLLFMNKIIFKIFYLNFHFLIKNKLFIFILIIQKK